MLIFFTLSGKGNINTTVMRTCEVRALLKLQLYSTHNREESCGNTSLVAWLHGPFRTLASFSTGGHSSIMRPLLVFLTYIALRNKIVASPTRFGGPCFYTCNMGGRAQWV
jgi:hypothetical protein